VDGHQRFDDRHLHVLARRTKDWRVAVVRFRIVVTDGLTGETAWGWWLVVNYLEFRANVGRRSSSETAD
jgi:hypothetical protein